MERGRKLKIVTRWRPTAGEPSPLWRQLWAKLLASREPSRDTTHETDVSEVDKDDGKSIPGNR